MATNISNKKLNTTFRGNVLRLVSGTGIAQIIGILSMPILSRLYTPEIFGTVGLFIALTTILGKLACMRYEEAIVLSIDESESANIIGISLIISIFYSLIVFIFVWMFLKNILNLVGLVELEPYIWFIPITVLLSGIHLAVNYWYTRIKNFTYIAAVNVASTLVTTIGNLVAGFAGYATSNAMITVNVGGRIITGVILGVSIWRGYGSFLLQNISLQKMWLGIKRYKKFPIYTSWSALLNVASWQLPTMMIGIYFTPAIVGFYYLSFRLLQAPVRLVGDAISKVFLEHAVEAYKKESLGIVVNKLFKRLVIVGLFPFLMLMLIGNDLFSIVFGREWAEAGTYTQILSIWAFSWFIASPLGSIFSIMEKQEVALKINVILFVSRILSIIIGATLGNIIVALSIFSFTGIIIYNLMVVAIFKYTNIPFIQYIDILSKALFVFLPFGVIIACLQFYNFPFYMILFFIIIFYLLYMKIFWKVLKI